MPPVKRRDLALRGVETFEGIHQARSDARQEAGAMIDLAVAAAGEMARERLFAEGPILLSAASPTRISAIATPISSPIIRPRRSSATSTISAGR